MGGSGFPDYRKSVPGLDQAYRKTSVTQSYIVGVSFAYKYGINFLYMRAVLIPHLVNGWPYLLIALVCVIVVHHFRERLDK
jgi:hypothetical protein